MKYVMNPICFPLYSYVKLDDDPLGPKNVSCCKECVVLQYVTAVFDGDAIVYLSIKHNERSLQTFCY
jgi:hypothetical protein